MSHAQWLVVVALAFVWGWLTADWRRDSLELAINTAVQVAGNESRKVMQGIASDSARELEDKLEALRNAQPREIRTEVLKPVLLTGACLMILSACTTAPSPVPNVRYQENLKTRCATQLPRLNGATGKDAAELLTVYLEIYGQCAARHNQLVDEINLRERVIYGKN